MSTTRLEKTQLETQKITNVIRISLEILTLLKTAKNQRVQNPILTDHQNSDQPHILSKISRKYSRIFVAGVINTATLSVVSLLAYYESVYYKQVLCYMTRNFHEMREITVRGF